MGRLEIPQQNNYTDKQINITTSKLAYEGKCGFFCLTFLQKQVAWEPSQSLSYDFHLTNFDVYFTFTCNADKLPVNLKRLIL